MQSCILKDIQNPKPITQEEYVDGSNKFEDIISKMIFVQMNINYLSIGFMIR